MLVTAVTRLDISNYVGTLITVYIVIIFVYLLVNMVLSFGARPPYSRWFDVVMTFMRDVSEPYLRVFRRFLPAVGGIDLSPMLAIIALVALRYVLTRLISGS